MACELPWTTDIHVHGDCLLRNRLSNNVCRGAKILSSGDNVGIEFTPDLIVTDPDRTRIAKKIENFIQFVRGI
jgi:hypothetical protein